MAMDMVAPVPTAGRVITTALLIFTIAALAFCLTRRIQRIKNWQRLPVPGWMVIAIYLDSMLFVVSTTILEKSFSLNSSTNLCDGAILLCLICYMSTKVLIYYFLVEKVYVIRNPWTPRMKDKLYLVNVSALGVYGILVIFAFIYRRFHIDADGQCTIGIGRPVLIPLTTYEMLLNVYLTSLFLAPLRKLHSFNAGPANQRLRRVATRTLIGSCVTLTSTCLNLGVLAALDSEPGWICLMLCNLDILFCILVLHWATSLDNEDGVEPLGSKNTGPCCRASVAASQVQCAARDYNQMILNEIDLKSDLDLPAMRRHTSAMLHVHEIDAGGLVCEFGAGVQDIEKGEPERRGSQM